MTCDDCSIREDCPFRRDCEALQKDTRMYRLNDRFTLEVNCKDKTKVQYTAIIDLQESSEKYWKGFEAGAIAAHKLLKNEKSKLNSYQMP